MTTPSLIFLDFFLCENATVQKSQVAKTLLHYINNKKQRVSYFCVDYFVISQSSNTTVLSDIFTAGVWDGLVTGAEVHPITRGVSSTALEL